MTRDENWEPLTAIESRAEMSPELRRYLRIIIAVLWIIAAMTTSAVVSKIGFGTLGLGWLASVMSKRCRDDAE